MTERPLSTGRSRSRTDQGRGRQWGWGRPSAGLSTLGVLIEDARRAQNLSQHELAAMVGMKIGEYRAQIKREVPPPKWHVLMDLIRATRCDPISAVRVAWDMTITEALDAIDGDSDVVELARDWQAKRERALLVLMPKAK